MTDVDFGGLTIAFDDRVLRPREWTLAQSTWAAELLVTAPAGPVLELFAGVGHIGLAAVASTDRELVMVDLNPAAVELARRNIDAAGLASRVTVRHGRIDEVLRPDERFAVVVADPPWVPSAGITEFPDDPPIAIDGGDDGLALARTCCDVIDRHLAPGGSAIVQIGTSEQAEALDQHLRESESGLRLVETRVHERGVLVALVRAGAASG
ncbi:methyltransferase [Aeromicrobium fastidiosum]|uniref:Methyltransferase n=1 Tax=Aeromicrobium fastidiosum TaxID=52699 RepID=A0A641AJ67_9ACTN|nr:methyltransferase [Aeromicrobium fastidiosum]KAA1374782.1 methyltransferase [Aeromicrobium fastidiosum]MBP2390668.1 methylase of polypeptide subunit release factors [Aeromicrobium fastidiosum]